MGKFSNVLIVTDLDGTLLDSQKHIGAKSIEAIRYFISEGGYFTFATGRLFQSFMGIYRQMILNAPVIFANGAQIVSMGNGDILYQVSLEEDFCSLCERILSEFPNVALEIYGHKRTGLVNANQISLKHMLDFSIEHTLYHTPAAMPFPWLKVLFTGSTEDLTKVAAMIETNYQKASVCFSSPVFLEVFSLCADKGIGALKLAQILNVNKHHLYAAGDQENDLPMLRASQISFAPENAVAAVKKQADVILPDHNSNMMASLIQHLDSIYSV